MLKTRSGEKITWKQFFARWKEGMETLSPSQRLKNEFISTTITWVGYIVGLVALIVYRDKLIVSWFAYGLMLIFFGCVWSTGIKVLGIINQLRFFKKMDKDSVNIEDVLENLGNTKGGETINIKDGDEERKGMGDMKGAELTEKIGVEILNEVIKKENDKEVQ